VEVAKRKIGSAHKFGDRFSRKAAGHKDAWLLFDVVHNNIKYDDCETMEEMLDGMRKHRRQRNFELVSAGQL
jgi:hypothetical protein